MQLIARIYEPDVAILPIGDHFTMGPREAAVALELLGVDKCIPSHYGTFPLLSGTPDELSGWRRTSNVQRSSRRDRWVATVRPSDGRERWFGSSGRRIPPIAVEGEHDLPLDEALVLDDVGDTAALREAFDAGRPVVVRSGERGGCRGGARPAGGLLRPRSRPTSVSCSTSTSWR